MKRNELKIISASRREEMVGFAPERLTGLLAYRCPPEKVHSVVLWTKRPENLLQNHSLKKCLKHYDQIFVHLTITGMGGTWLEPGIPDSKQIIRQLPDLIDFIQSPQRLRLRFDPILHIQYADGKIYTNLPCFESIAVAASTCGIRGMIVSWAEHYPKVVKRFEERNVKLIQPDLQQMNEELKWIRSIADPKGISITGCCMPHMQQSACIDGELLTQLHPAQSRAILEKAGGQRPACGCTKSWDIGWYYPCPGGCVYCYANPKL